MAEDHVVDQLEVAALRRIARLAPPRRLAPLDRAQGVPEEDLVAHGAPGGGRGASTRGAAVVSTAASSRGARTRYAPTVRSGTYRSSSQWATRGNVRTKCTCAMLSVRSITSGRRAASAAIIASSSEIARASAS